MSPLVLQKMNEDNFDELDDYGTPFCEGNTRTGLVISLCLISDHLITLIPPNRLKFYSVVVLSFAEVPIRGEERKRPTIPKPWPKAWRGRRNLCEGEYSCGTMENHRNVGLNFMAVIIH